MKTLTTHEALEYTGKSRATLYRHCKPAYGGRAGDPSLWALEDLDALIARYMVRS
jgi:hypothetical protein